MMLRTKGEQKAFLDGFESCADCIEKYLSAEGKKQLDCLISGVRSAIEIEDISALSENKGEWIPVSERLPENNDDVLVYDYSDIFVAWYSGINGNWCSADNRFDEYTPILAWMPLPEPYKKEGE